jgi:hypothetical protein
MSAISATKPNIVRTMANVNGKALLLYSRLYSAIAQTVAKPT